MHAAPSPRPLLGLVGAQALGMFNDNLLKMVVILLLVGPRSTEAAQQAVTFQCFLAYTLPYVLLSLPAGALADAFSKRRVLVTLKIVEVAVMLLAGLALADGGRPALLVVLCLVGTLSALSSPSKYGLLPELLAESRLASGNGIFLLASWSATILGTGLAGALLDLVGPQRRGQVGLVLAALSVAGTLFALRMVGDLPRGVIRQWSRWCRHPEYAVGVEGEAMRALYRRLTLPLLSVSLTDDEYMSASNVAVLHGFYENSRREMRRLTPTDVGLARVGHFGYFRAGPGQRLWPATQAWIEGAVRA